MLVAAGASGAACTRQPQAAPRFDYTLLDGSAHSAEALRGQVTLISFWATTCSICVAEMPRLVALHRKFSGRGLQTLAVSMQDDPPALVSSFAQSRGLPFGVAIDNTGAIARAFGGVTATPTSVLIDKHGLIVERTVGPPDPAALQARVEQLLAAA